jgi:2-methylcitrate dehydratase PrpD
VDIRHDPALTGAQAVVAIEMADGTTLEARCEHPRGSFENPLSRAQIEGKFRTYAGSRIPPARGDEVIAAVNGLEDLASVRDLMDMLRQGPRRAKGERAA